MRKREIILLLLMALVLIACARCTRAEMQASPSTDDVTVTPPSYYPDPTEEPMPFYLTEEYQEMKRAEQEEKEREAELLRKSIEEYEEERQAEAERQFEEYRNNPVGDPVEDPIEDEVEIDEDVLYLMANCVEAEAGDQGELGKRYVADVILNRVDHKDFPDTIEGVITQKYHFSAYWDGGMDRFKPTEETIRICREELVTRQNYEILFFAMGRYNPYGTPSFQYKDHYFSTE